MTTKNYIKAQLTIAINLSNQLHKILNSICDELAPNGEDDLYDLMNQIESHERTDINEIYNDIESRGYFKDAKITEDGEKINIPSIEIDEIFNVETKVPANGGTLIAELAKSDSGTEQSCIMYTPEGTDFAIDIAMAEIKSGELAEACNLPTDNNNIELYVYTDPFSEDATKNWLLKHDEYIASTTTFDNSRLNTLLCNAIETIEDQSIDISRIKFEIGMYDEEYTILCENDTNKTYDNNFHFYNRCTILLRNAIEMLQEYMDDDFIKENLGINETEFIAIMNS